MQQARARGRAREQILRAALRLIGERGLHSVTHRDVAAAAGVSPGATTYHFASLDDLLTAALELFVEEEVARVEAAASALASADGDADAEAVLAAVAAQIDLTLTTPAEQVAQFELYLEATRNARLGETAARCLAAYRASAAAALRLAGAPDPEALAPTALALVDGLMLHQLADPRPDFTTTVLQPALRHLLPT